MYQKWIFSSSLITECCFQIGPVDLSMACNSSTSTYGQNLNKKQNFTGHDFDKQVLIRI